MSPRDLFAPEARRLGSPGAAADKALPSWPVTGLFVLFPVWWLLGVIDVALIPAAAVMGIYLARQAAVRVPYAFGIWALFLFWAGLSVIKVHGGGALMGFTYRWLIYASATVLFVYLFNARRQLTTQRVLGLLTAVWLTTVLGGLLGVWLPTVVVHTPMSYVMPQGLMANDLVNHMVIRRFSQYNPDSYFDLSPRPAAPFRFTNNWGNVYSILMPIVVAYALRAGRRTRFWLFAFALPLSTVPAFLTLNRGMFLGLGVAGLYVAVRLALVGHARALAWLGVAAAAGVLLFNVLPVQERIDARLGQESVSSTATRTSLYKQSLEAVPQSPFFGFGVPQESTNPNDPPVGTQGQVWMILISHGPVALVSAMGWFALVVWLSRRRNDTAGLAAHTSVLVATMELLYYGVLPYGLPLMMSAAALALRPLGEDDVSRSPARRGVRQAKTAFDRRRNVNVQR